MNKTITISIILLAIIGLGFWWAESRKDDNVNNIPTSADNAPEGSIHNLPVPTAVSKVKLQVASELKISDGLVIVMSAFEKEWSDGCLGLGGPAESCLQALVSGYEVTIQAEGKTRVYRTNIDGSVIRREK